VFKVFTVVRNALEMQCSKCSVVRSEFEVEVVSRRSKVGSELVRGGSQWFDGSSK